MTETMIEAHGLEKRFGPTVALAGLDLEVARGHDPGRPRPQRRRQDHRGADPDHACAARRRPRPRRRPRRRCRGRRGAAPDRRHRPGRHARRGALRPPEPGHDRPPERPAAPRRRRPGRSSCSPSSISWTRATASIREYSGGMRRRLDLAASLVTRPPVLFLDEPTTGLDPTSRVRVWDVIRGLVADGATLLLTTQTLDEADELADRIVVVDHGRVIAAGSAAELKAQVGGARLEVRAHRRRCAARRRRSRRSSSGAVHVSHDGRTLRAPVRGGAGLATAVVRALDDAGMAVDDVQVHPPSLDDVFFALTGHPADETIEDERDGGVMTARLSRHRRPDGPKPRPHRPGAAPALGRDRPAGALHRALHLRVRGGRDAARRQQLYRLRHRRPACAQPDDVVDGHGGRPQHRPRDRRHRPAAHAADVAAGGARGPLAGRSHDGDPVRRRSSPSPGWRSAGGRSGASPTRSPASPSSCSSPMRCRGRAPASG